MVDKRGLQSVRYEVPSPDENDIGTVVPANLRRYIYRVKVQEDSGNVNRVDLKKYIPPAEPETAELVDEFRLTSHETYIDPKQLTEDALPLYILEGGSQMRAVGVADASILLEYEDSE
ncbi:hypothetical protein ES703_26045 [subsurface metagenome]